MLRRASLFVVAVALLAACTHGPEKQWYKPNVSYTVADFDRDRAACTRERTLDEACLRERGWVSLGVSAPGKVTGQSPADEQLPPRFRTR